MRDYEAVYIVDPTLETEQIGPIVEKYRQIVLDNGGEVVRIDQWEKRRLAYEVKGRWEGIYIVMNFKGEPATTAELDRVMKISEDVMRYIVVRDETPPQAQPQQESAPAAAAAPVEAAEAAPEAVEVEAEAIAEPEAEAEAEAESEA